VIAALAMLVLVWLAAQISADQAFAMGVAVLLGFGIYAVSRRAQA
jgi:hypothetical protein